jgi:hypothetical protein
VSALEPALLERFSRCCSVRGILMRILIEMPRPGIGVWHAEHFGERALLLSLATIPQNALHLTTKRLVDVFDAAIGFTLCGVTYAWYGMRLRGETGDSGATRCCSASSASGRTGGALSSSSSVQRVRELNSLRPSWARINEMNGHIFKLKNDRDAYRAKAALSPSRRAPAVLERA